MLEWYRTGDDMRQGIALLSELAEAIFSRGAAEVVKYADVFQQHVGIDPHAATADDVRLAADRLGIRAPESFVSADRDAWLDLLLVERIQPRLGASRPTIVCDYPASQAALACTRRAGHEVAERFELYVDGMELANGYHELLDSQVLRERASVANRLRTAEGKPALPEDSRLLAAMECGLPACSGVALGFDRAVMIVTGAHSIQEVIPFPIDRA
jgi:lysyl-tRNA synthetase class 2